MRASENLHQWETRTRDHTPVSAGWGEGLSWPLTLPQTTQTQFLMESGWCYVGNVGWIIIPREHDLIRKKPSPYLSLKQTLLALPFWVIRWSKSRIIISGTHAMNPLTAKETMNFTSFIAADDDGSCISGIRIVLMILIVIWTGSAQTLWHLDEHHEIRLMLERDDQHLSLALITTLIDDYKH